MKSLPACLQGEIAQARIGALALEACYINNSVALAHALADSHIKDISLTNVDANEPLSLFSETLAARLPLMQHLQTLIIDMVDRDKPLLEQLDLDSAMVGLAKAAANCPSLYSLGLAMNAYSTSMDNALADLVRSSTLSELDVSAVSIHDGEKPCLFPLLLAALKSDYKLTSIKFGTIYIGTSPWDPDSVENARTLMSLNQAGRGYLGKDPTNRFQASHVLGQTSDNLDCIFTHLQENPIVCAGVTNVVSNRKRKAEAGTRSPSLKQLRQE